MSQLSFSFGHLSDDDLLAEVRRLAAVERRCSARLIASLAELDARRLYLAEGCASLFTWCTQVLHLSEYAAYARIEAARAARRFPVILELLAQGDIHLTAIGLLAPHLTVDNHDHLLASARHKSKRDVERLVAATRPEPDVESSVQKSLLKPVAPELYKVQFTASHQTYEKLRRVQDLLRHTVPGGDIGEIIDRALTVLLKELRRTKLGAAERPRAPRGGSPRGRHIPAAVKREVWRRDDGRCAFVGTLGRCTETAFLEFHHVVPYASGGTATTANIELRCRSHNAYEAAASIQATLPRENSGLF